MKLNTKIDETGEHITRHVGYFCYLPTLRFDFVIASIFNHRLF